MLAFTERDAPMTARSNETSTRSKMAAPRLPTVTTFSFFPHELNPFSAHFQQPTTLIDLEDLGDYINRFISLLTKQIMLQLHRGQ